MVASPDITCFLLEGHLMKIKNLESDVILIDLDPAPGFEGVFGAYIIKSDKIAILDVGPASSLPNLFSALKILKIDPKDVDYLLCSHIHLDHTGGLGAAMRRLPNAISIVHERGLDHLVDPSRLWENSLRSLGDLAKNYGQPESVPRERLVTAKDGLIIELGGVSLDVLLTPGHASHHISFFEKKTRRLFVGEAAGINLTSIGGLHPATPAPFDLKQTLSSIDKMIAVNPFKIYYAHFGEADNGLHQLNLFKQQLVLWGTTIAQHLDDNSEWQEIFAEIVAKKPSLGKIYDLSAQRQASLFTFIKNDILGYQNYLRKEGTRILTDLARSQVTL
jgi:glyoxylase-like metal-dependent hydrolase (beta-lactamase superfamily II)